MPRNVTPLPFDANRDLTYGEFTKRRNALFAKINRLKKEYKRATDDRHTHMVNNPGQYALAELTLTEVELGNLIAEWTRVNQPKKGTP